MFVVKKPKLILLDIEGCITSISFVSQTLFPYARQRLATFIKKNKNDGQIQKIIKSAKRIYAQSAENPDGSKNVLDIFYEWMDANAKIAPLKELQGLIWKSGYANGEIKGHVYRDAYECMCRWYADKSLKMAIYSSGSVPAQKLLFGYSIFGDLNELHSANFDIKNAGSKMDSASYLKICQSLDEKPENILFISDNYLELKAAQAIGMHVVQSIREGVTANADYAQITDFHQIQWRKSKL